MEKGINKMSAKSKYAMHLGNKLVGAKNEDGLRKYATRKDAFKAAWAQVELFAANDIQIVTFEKKDSSITTRIVTKSKGAILLKGGNRTLPNDYLVRVDLEKLCKGVSNSVISFKSENLLKIE